MVVLMGREDNGDHEDVWLMISKSGLDSRYLHVSKLPGTEDSGGSKYCWPCHAILSNKEEPFQSLHM